LLLLFVVVFVSRRHLVGIKSKSKCRFV